MFWGISCPMAWYLMRMSTLQLAQMI